MCTAQLTYQRTPNSVPVFHLRIHLIACILKSVACFRKHVAVLPQLEMDQGIADDLCGIKNAEDRGRGH